MDLETIRKQQISDMMSDIVRLTKERDEAKSSLDTLSTRFTALIQQNNALAAENERLSDELSKAETERDYQKLLAIDCAEQCIKSGNEIVELSEKLAAMESQKPLCVVENKNLAKLADGKEAKVYGCAPHMLYNPDYHSKLYTKPAPADKPAVAVPYEAAANICSAYVEFWDACTESDDPRVVFDHWAATEDGKKLLAAAPSHSQQSAQRITEQDAKEIFDSVEFSLVSGESNTTDQWLDERGRALLTKLNADRCPSHESEQ